LYHHETIPGPPCHRSDRTDEPEWLEMNEISYCEFCGKEMKSHRGKNHITCGIISRRLRECKPENIEWVKMQIRDRYGVDVR